MQPPGCDQYTTAFPTSQVQNVRDSVRKNKLQPHLNDEQIKSVLNEDAIKNQPQKKPTPKTKSKAKKKSSAKQNTSQTSQGQDRSMVQNGS